MANILKIILMRKFALGIVFGSKYISQVRKEKGITQSGLAEMLNVTDRAVSKWETGRSLPDIATMMQLCEIFDISVDDLLHADSSKMTNQIYDRTGRYLDKFHGYTTEYQRKPFTAAELICDTISGPWAHGEMNGYSYVVDPQAVQDVMNNVTDEMIQSIEGVEYFRGLTGYMLEKDKILCDEKIYRFSGPENVEIIHGFYRLPNYHDPASLWEYYDFDEKCWKTAEVTYYDADTAVQCVLAELS